MWASVHDVSHNRGVSVRWDEPVSINNEHLITVHLKLSVSLIQRLGIDLLHAHRDPCIRDAIIDSILEEAVWSSATALRRLGISIDEPDTPLGISGDL